MFLPPRMRPLNVAERISGALPVLHSTTCTEGRAAWAGAARAPSRRADVASRGASPRIRMARLGTGSLRCSCGTGGSGPAAAARLTAPEPLDPAARVHQLLLARVE